MKRIEEPARQIPVMAETEVLVVGGGPAGLAPRWEPRGTAPR